MKQSDIETHPTFTHFQKNIYSQLIKIPKGKVISYQALAKRAGHPKAAIAVGQAMAKNPHIVEIPCHRVVNSNGKIGHYSGPYGKAGKIKLLKEEGVRFLNKDSVDPRDMFTEN